jgi:hypothetical protein
MPKGGAMFQKERKSAWDVLFGGFMGAVVILAIIGFFVLLGVTISGVSNEEPSSTNLVRILVLVMAAVGFGFGLIAVFLTTSKIRFDGNRAAVKLTLQTGTTYNPVFINLFTSRLMDLGPVTIEEFMLFLKNNLSGYYRGENAVTDDVSKPSWDEISTLAVALLAGRADSEKLILWASDWIRDRKREEIE